MKIYMEENVFDATIKRINRIFDEFNNVCVNFSGGKDSTVCLELCLAIARQRGRLPLNVMFIDQEIEWEHTIEYMRRVMYRKEVNPIWLQMPIKIFNATNHDEEWLWCWEEGGNWVREKEPISIKENVFGTMRFGEIFGAVCNHFWENEDCAFIGGVRGEESPKRVLAATGSRCYKEITYGALQGWDGEEKKHIVFYPLYDWSYTDIWKFIFDNKVDYNRIYDFMYAHGVPVNRMRVSNLNHETALSSLAYLQELEPEMWNKAAARLKGINTIKHCTVADCIPKTLPEMFSSWEEYIIYLVDNIVKEEHKKTFKDKVLRVLFDFDGYPDKESVYKTLVRCIILDDYYFTTIENLYTHPGVRAWQRHKKELSK